MERSTDDRNGRSTDDIQLFVPVVPATRDKSAPLAPLATSQVVGFTRDHVLCFTVKFVFYM